MGGYLLGEAMRGIPWPEDGAVESVRSKPFVEVRGLHGLLHIPHVEHPLGRIRRGLEAGPHREVYFGVDLMDFSPIHPPVVLCYSLVHLILVADKLVLHND